MEFQFSQIIKKEYRKYFATLPRISFLLYGLFYIKLASIIGIHLISFHSGDQIVVVIRRHISFLIWQPLPFSNLRPPGNCLYLKKRRFHAAKLIKDSSLYPFLTFDINALP